MNRELLEQQLSQLPLYVYVYVDPQSIEYSDRIRWICEHECPCTARPGLALPV